MPPSIRFVSFSFKSSDFVVRHGKLPYTYGMRVAVTGADGLLGSNVVRLLVEAGHSVVAFIQTGKRTPTLDGLPVEIRFGDLLEAESLKRAFDACQAVIHIAANTSVWPARSSRVRTVNITGTENVLLALHAVQVDRYVHVGTATSFTPGTKEHPGDETTPFGCARYGLDYIDSKRQAMDLVLHHHRQSGLPAVLVHPTYMIGPYDSTPSSGTMLIRLYQGKIPGYTNGGKSWSPVRDTATAIVQALKLGGAGESYIAGGYNLSYKEFFDLAAETLGVRPITLHIPDALALATGAVASLASAVTHHPPLLSYRMARVGLDGHYYSSEKATRVLQMPHSDLAGAIRDCMAWLKENGYVVGRR